MVIKEEFVCVIFEIVSLGFFYVDLQCPLINGRCIGRESTMATSQ